MFQTQIDNDMGSKNNQMTVNSSDFEVFEALAQDSSGEPKPGQFVDSSGEPKPGQFIDTRGNQSQVSL